MGSQDVYWLFAFQMVTPLLRDAYGILVAEFSH